MKHCVLLLFLTAAWAGPGEPWRYESSLDAMGSTYSIAVYDQDRDRAKNAVDQAFEEVRRLDQMLSNYKPESELSQVNRGAAQGPVPVSQEFFDFVAACLRYSEQSEGAFDITVGPLLKLWGFYKGSGRLPHRAEVRGTLERVGYRHVQLDVRNRTIRFLRQGIELDPGGIGKGYAVDRMVSILRANGIRSAMVSASGSSIYGLGAPPGGKGWKVSVRDAKNAEKTVETVYLHDQSLSTSGNYEKFFRAEGHIYSHIFDPRTGFPAQGMLSVSVLAPLTLDSEAWTKPFFINGRAWAAHHQPKQFRVFLCEDKPDQPCAWLP